MIEIARELLNDGWKFRYDEGTQYIGIYHPKGGKQSILHFTSPVRADQFGPGLAKFFNNLGERD